MPTPVLLILILLIGTYGVLAGSASLGFLLARREASPSDPPDWPSVSVVVPTAAPPTSNAIQQIQDCDYPTDRLEILVPTCGPADRSSCGGDEGTPVRPVSGFGETTGTPFPSAPPESVTDAAEGDIVLSMPTEGMTSSGWIRSMVRRCTPDTPIVVGPTIIEHRDLFLPRLQGLSHLGRLAFTVGLSHVGLPSLVETSNGAARVDALPAHDVNDPAQTQLHGAFRPTFNPEVAALVARTPVDSFDGFFRHLTHGLRRTGQSPSWLVWGQGVGLWLVHTVLLACAVVAVAIPAWQQPTLLALVAKMGADVILTLPAATHYGQRGLFRSLVPTELLLIFALPLAGCWSLTTPHTGQVMESP